MRRHEVVPGLATLALAWTLASACPVPGHAARRAKPSEAPPVPLAPVLRDSTIAVGADSLAGFDVLLARAAERFAAGDPGGVVRLLGGLDLSAEAARPDADRAAFLLAQAYRALGSRERFAAVVAQVAGWERETGYTRWLASQLALDRTEATGEVSAGLDALFPATAPYAHVFRSLAGFDSAAGAFTLPGDFDTSSALGADLAGAVAMARAARATEGREDPGSILAAVPPASRYRARAAHLAGKLAIERGDREAGVAALRGLLASDSLYAARREVLLELAADAIDAGRWSEAESLYAATDTDWQGQRGQLETLLASNHFDPLWDEWRSPAGPSRSLPLSGVLSDDLSLAWSRSAARDSNQEPGEPPLWVVPSERSAMRWPVPPPPAEAWNRVTAAEWSAGETRAATSLLEGQAQAERRRLGARRRYLAWGDRQVAGQDSLLAAGGESLAGIGARLDEWDQRLRRVRDDAMRRIAERSRRIAEETARQRLAMRGLRHLQLEGPHRERPIVAPAPLPGPDTLLTVEEQLAGWIENTARRIESEGPATIARSYEMSWRPDLIDRVGLLAGASRDARNWAARLDHGVDSMTAASATSERLGRLERMIALHAGIRDSAERAVARLRDEVARTAVMAARAAIETERESIEYGLAASAYAACVGVPAGDSAAAGVPDSAATALRPAAIAHLQRFLSNHPASGARGEVRFRLADLMLSEERGAFRARMAEYVKRQAEGLDPGPLPVLGDAAALDLYRTILREDPEFPHLDAVRFNAGMILADAGDAEAEHFFTGLVKLHPASAYAQEAWVRLGDMRFAERRFREASDFYAQAAAGADLTIRAVATYKLGWAGFRDERFLDAATAFRDVLDLYASEARPKIRADVEGEAETYLVQALARAGGAETFARLFDGTRDRPHEEKILGALALHFRRYDRHADAIATDRMALERYGRSPNALRSARRITESYEKWNDAAGYRAALEEMAPRFAPGSGWADAQPSDSVRAAGAEFSRRAWLTLAAHHHREARSRDQASDWRAALGHYETLIERFAADSEAARYRLYAGEAAAHLERYPAALAHYARAASEGSDSIRVVADWQRVAISDEWYGKRRNGRRDGFEPPVDSLARAVLAEADRYLERHPEDPRGADLTWRQGQIALAHEWNERAVADLGRMVARYPGDARTPQAAALKADAIFLLERFADAGAAYEEAFAIAKRAGVDSLAARTGEAIPICYYRDAEAAVSADSTDHRRHAVLFEKVAAGWPTYKYADVARYRAGRAWLRAGDADAAVRAFDALGRDFPNSEFARDAHLEMARALEQQGKKESAAQALSSFATRFASDSTAGEAMLKAADLYESADRWPLADSLRLAWVRKFPHDHAQAMEIYEALARRELKSVGKDGRTLASLLPPQPAPAPAPAKSKSKAGKPAKVPPAPAVARTATSLSYLAQYMKLSKEHPELASHSLLAEVKFRQGEEARDAGRAVAITLPLDQSIKRRQKHLDEALVHYKAATSEGVAEWAHASAFRIGQTLVEFGAALEGSQRPADLGGDDLAAYEDVLLDRAQVFYDRGEEVWVDLLRQKGEEAPADDWIAQARTSLWGRLGLRFAYQAETEYPLVKADEPARPKPVKPVKLARPARIAKAVKPAKKTKPTREERRTAAAAREQAASEGSR